MRVWTPAIGIVLFFGLLQRASASDSCPPLTMVSSVDMRVGDDDRIYVPVKLNDVSKSMLVDTGGFFDEISASAVAELKLATRQTNLEITGVTGDKTQAAAHASFALGNLHASGMDFMVMSGAQGFASDIPDAAGIIAPNLLRNYDLDLDMGGKKVNLLSQDHCSGKVVYWPAGTVAVVPFTLNANLHIMLPVTLDGHSLIAMLDSGASGSVLNLGTATTFFSLTPGDANTPVERSEVGSPKTYSHRFKSLSLEGLAISNPSMELIPDLMRTMDPHDTVENDTRIRSRSQVFGLGDMILGMNVLKHLHVYIAYKERKLYITPAEAPVAAAPTESKAAPAQH